MKKFFLIGGMGSGKSTVRAVLEQEGACAIDLDEIGHEVLYDRVVKNALVDAFGADVRNARGEIDRAALAKAAFVDASHTARLNEITHPAIVQAYEQAQAACEAQGCTSLVVEYSAFDGVDDPFIEEGDCVVAVCAPEADRIARLCERGWNKADAACRIKQQVSDDIRRAHADVVFENTQGQDALCRAVRAWWEQQQ